MNWNKAGRKRKNAPLNINIDCSTHIDIKINIEQKILPWTNEELRVYKNGPAALARAVVEQWKKDGCPDEPGIKPWIALVKQFETEDNG